MRISVGILSRPQDPLLGECVSRVRKFADEVIVGRCGEKPDHGDKRLEFGKDKIDAYGFSWVRNQILKQCSGHWIVWVDTDEVLVGERERLEEEIQAAEASGHLGLMTERYDAPKSSTGLGEEAEELDCNKWKIHKREPGLFWKGLVHEELILHHNTHLSAKSVESSLRIVHHPHLNDDGRVATGPSLYAELLCRGFDLPRLRSGTDKGWYDQVDRDREYWRTRQAGYWIKRGVLNLHKTHCNKYASHIITMFDLVRAFKYQHGRDPRIIEMGSGMGSTPAFGMATEHFESYETDPKWAHLMGKFGTRFVEHYDRVNVDGCDILFVDGLVETREDQVNRCADAVPYMVCHDTEDVIYGYERCIPPFKYKYTDMRLVPWTTVVSNKEDVSFLGGGICDYVPVLDCY